MDRVKTPFLTSTTQRYAPCFLPINSLFLQTFTLSETLDESGVLISVRRGRQLYFSLHSELHPAHQQPNQPSSPRGPVADRIFHWKTERTRWKVYLSALNPSSSTGPLSARAPPHIPTPPGPLASGTLHSVFPPCKAGPSFMLQGLASNNSQMPYLNGLSFTCDLTQLEITAFICLPAYCPSLPIRMWLQGSEI